ncbi:sterol desaturase family protein [Paraburkholderia sp. RP-4-7]|uniref:Sterol desaturase family protein n=1 Tax=Paraburkholderia polaris TaxID=2728848 RepID=A0A848IQQ7_9BURK|nr:sterol desaturase family protein [Paraburkholderia polaris]NMM04071.1 sterol desaturase family protein [Paraburkholderia polaris]
MNSHVMYLLIALAIVGFAVAEVVSRQYRETVYATSNDTKLELLMTISLVAFTQPVILLATDRLCAWLAPDLRGAWSGFPWWAMVGILLVGDDMLQYWWHRASHSGLLWPLHRAHHSASYMSIRVTYRNNFLYYLMMPGLWVAGVLLYFGFGGVYYAYILVKLVVILSAHCAWAWDAPLYRTRALHPVMWIVERVISTPATHRAHHAITNVDGIGHYKGNFGNLLFFWDVLFGTAHITRKYPAEVGLRDDRLFGYERWDHQMFYPLLQSSREYSALKFGGQIYSDESEAEMQINTTTSSAR